MSGAESKTATLRMATEKLAELKGGNIEGAVAQKKLENKIKAIDEETDEQIKEIKSEPIDEEQIKQQAKADYDSKLKENAREALVTVKRAEAAIEQAKHNVSVTEKSAGTMLKEAELELLNAQKAAETMRAQAALTVKARTEELEQIKEIAKEAEERANLSAKHKYDLEIKSVNDKEKAMANKIERATAAGKKKKKESEEELEILKLRNTSKNSGEALYERLFNTVKEISVNPAEPADKKAKK